MRSIFSGISARAWRDILLVCLADGVVGASFGAWAVAGGLPAWFPVALSLLVFAGGSQFAAVSVLLGGGTPLLAALAGVALNGRLLAYGFSACDWLGRGFWRRLCGMHLIIDESVAFALGQTDTGLRTRLYWASGLTLFVIWNISVALGAWVGQAAGDMHSWGLDAVFPAVLCALVLPALRRRDLRPVVATGCVLALAGAFLVVPGVAVLGALLALLPRIVGLWRLYRSEKNA